MTSFSDEDCEKLIELIRQYPPIYNAQLDSYKDKNLKDIIWINIAESINKTDSECRKKWKLIKDTYNRYKRKQKHSTRYAAPAKNSKWQFYESLRFLEITSSEGQSSSSVVGEHIYTSSEVGRENTLPEVTDEPVRYTSSRELEPIPGTSTSTPILEKSGKKNTKRKRQDKDFIKFSKERHENRKDQPELLLESQQPVVDDISTFTKHIEMTLRKLSARSRAMAKNEIFNIVSKYEIEDIDGQNERHHTSSSYNSSSPISVASSALPDYP